MNAASAGDGQMQPCIAVRVEVLKAQAMKLRSQILTGA